MTVTDPSRAGLRTPKATRTHTIDGLKGIAIVLVVLFHWHILWPRAEASRLLGSFDFLFSAGNVAVTIFFAVSGYLVTARLLVAANRRRIIGPLVYLERRTLRIAVQVFLLLGTILLVWRFDETDTASSDATERSLWAAATFTFNRYVSQNALNARSDLGPLYFLSIDLQYFIAATLVIILLAGHRRLLGTVIFGTFVFVCWWRWQFYVDAGWFQAALSTVARSDGLLAGSFLAVANHRGALSDRFRTTLPAIAGGSALVLLGTVVSCTFVDIGGYFGPQSVIAAVAAALCTWALAVSPDRAEYSSIALSWLPLGVLGRASLTIFVWHVPILMFVARHFGEVSVGLRSLVALTLLAGICAVVERYYVPRVEQALSWLFSRRPWLSS